MFPLRVRSYYSLLQGTSSPAALCRQAKRYGYTGLALTDRDNLYGLWDFLKSCKKEGLRPVVGAEITDPGSKQCIICLVRNRKGYSNLCFLLTNRHMEKKFSLATGVQGYAEGLVVLCRDYELLKRYSRQGVNVVADLGSKPTGGGHPRILHDPAFGLVCRPVAFDSLPICTKPYFAPAKQKTSNLVRWLSVRANASHEDLPYSG